MRFNQLVLWLLTSPANTRLCVEPCLGVTVRSAPLRKGADLEGPLTLFIGSRIEPDSNGRKGLRSAQEVG
jgi:hypothetical protein